MIGRHVSRGGCIAEVWSAYLVTTNVEIIVIDFERRSNLINVHSARSQVIGHAVKMIIESNVVIGADPHVDLDVGYCEGFGGQRLSVGLIELLEALPPRSGRHTLSSGGC